MAANQFASRDEPLERESAAGLLSRLLADGTALVRNEVALAKTGIAELAVAAVVLLTGAIALLAAMILALAEVMAPWLAALIVGVVLGIAGLLLIRSARHKLHPFRHAEMIARRT